MLCLPHQGLHLPEGGRGYERTSRVLAAVRHLPRTDLAGSNLGLPTLVAIIISSLSNTLGLISLLFFYEFIILKVLQIDSCTLLLLVLNLTVTEFKEVLIIDEVW